MNKCRDASSGRFATCICVLFFGPGYHLLLNHITFLKWIRKTNYYFIWFEVLKKDQKMVLI